MAQIKPIDLKKIAKRFTEEFYPDWVSRFDRIWAMFEKIDPDSIPTGLDKLQHQLGNAFGITGTVGPESQECIGGIAVCAFTYKQVQDKSTVSEDEIRQKISIIPNFKITPALQRKLEHVLAEMVPSMVPAMDVHLENQEVEELCGFSKKVIQNYFIVYVSRKSGFGVERFPVSEEELHLDFLSQKESLDIIVYLQSVEIRPTVPAKNLKEPQFIPIELHSYILKMLVFFLKFKDEPLSALELYHCAWKDAPRYNPEISDHADIIDEVKAGVSVLRKKMDLVETFIIPPASRNSNTYVCKGNFKFCLILNDVMDNVCKPRED